MLRPTLSDKCETIFIILTVSVIVNPVLHIANGNTIEAQAQKQIQQNKFFMIIKTHSTALNNDYKVDNVTSNIQSTILNNTSNTNKKIEYDLKHASVTISDTAAYWTLPFKIIDTNTHNIIKTNNAQIGTGINPFNYTKEFNTQTRVATYTGYTRLIDYNRIGLDTPDVDIKAIVYPNGTGIIETKQQ